MALRKVITRRRPVAPPKTVKAAAKPAAAPPSRPAVQEPVSAPPPPPEKPAEKPAPKLTADEMQRALVRQKAGLGIPLPDVATLSKCAITDVLPGGKFAEEVAFGRAETRARVAQSLLDKAIDGQPASMIFYAKCQLDWNEAGTGPAERGPVEDDVTEIELRVVDANGRRVVNGRSNETPRGPSEESKEALRAAGRRGAASKWARFAAAKVAKAEHPDPGMVSPTPEPGPVQGGTWRERIGEVTRLRDNDDSGSLEEPEYELRVHPGSPEDPEAIGEETTDGQD